MACVIKYHRRTLCASHPAPFECLPFSGLLFVDSAGGVGGSVRIPEVVLKAKCNGVSVMTFYLLYPI